MMKVLLAATAITLGSAQASSQENASNFLCNPKKVAYEKFKQAKWKPRLLSILEYAGAPAEPGKNLQVVWFREDRMVMVTVENADTGILCVVSLSTDRVVP